MVAVLVLPLAAGGRSPDVNLLFSTPAPTFSAPFSLCLPGERTAYHPCLARFLFFFSPFPCPTRVAWPCTPLLRRHPSDVHQPGCEIGTARLVLRIARPDRLQALFSICAIIFLPKLTRTVFLTAVFLANRSFSTGRVFDFPLMKTVRSDVLADFSFSGLNKIDFSLIAADSHSVSALTAAAPGLRSLRLFSRYVRDFPPAFAVPRITVSLTGAMRFSPDLRGMSLSSRLR